MSMQNWSIHAGLLVGAFLFFGSSNGQAQLIHQEGFETDGDGTRYTIVDRGFEITTAGPGVWAHSFDATQIGLVQVAPEKRAAILWDQNADFNDLSNEALEVMVSTVSWAIDSKDGARIGFFPGFQNVPGSLFLSQLLQSEDHDVFEIPTLADLPDADSIDLLIHTNEVTPVPEIAFIDYAVPVIAFDALNHDDTAILGIGAALDFPDAFSVNIVEENEDHPALAGKTGTIPWGLRGVSLQGLGKPQPGGKTLVTVVNPTTGAEQPALFVVEKGGGLLGSFSPPIPEGESYFVGAALNKFGDGLTRTLDLNPINIAGMEDVKFSVALAATDADFEPEDFFQISIDTTGLGEFELIADYVGVPGPAHLEDNLTGHVLSPNFFQDRTFDIPDGSPVLSIRFQALNTWGNEIIGIDDIRVFAGSGTLPGDFNEDGTYGVDDVDSLVAEIVAPTGDLSFDLTGDMSVDDADLQQWLAVAGPGLGFEGPLLPGDANLDGSVNATDLNTVGLGWQQTVAGWSAGDFTADGSVTAGDLNLLALNWQETVPLAAGANAVPEPATPCWLILGLLAHLWRNK